jgi:hypothetical protein
MLVDDVSWKEKDKRSIVFGIAAFIKKYHKNIIAMFALGTKDNKYGFFEVKNDEKFASLKTKQLLIVARKNKEVKIENIFKEIKEYNLYKI